MIRSLTVLAAMIFSTSSHAGIPVEIFINNFNSGPKNGCSGLISEKEGSMTCGHSPWVSKVSWRLLESDAEGEHYVILRAYPLGQSSFQVASKHVTFSGKEIELWKDDKQRIVLRRPTD